jgi:hypothetical protein
MDGLLLSGSPSKAGVGGKAQVSRLPRSGMTMASRPARLERQMQQWQPINLKPAKTSRHKSKTMERMPSS